jgi:putative aminopeptidase FrvX
VKQITQQLVEAYGPSGHEQAVRALIAQFIGGYVQEARTDALGNLIARQGQLGPGGKRVMIAAHMDEIGVIVTFLDKKGYARIMPLGGLSPITVVGSRVVFGNGVTGVIGWEKWLRTTSDRPTWDEMFVDTGATSPETSPVQVGDAAALVRPFVDLGARWVAKAMDDRIACAVAIESLRRMSAGPNELYWVFTAQEEVGTRGAATAAFGVEPEVALSVDVTLTGDTPEAQPMAVSLGGGPAIKVMDSGMLTHPGVKAWMVSTAQRAGIPFQIEVFDRGSTDARAMQLSRGGVPAGCLSIPCRYVHTQSEMVDAGDVEQSVRLLVAMLSAEIAL